MTSDKPEPGGPDLIDVEVGRAIQRLRKERKLNQDGLGQAIGVSFQQVQKYERGTNRVSASMLVRTARVLGVHPSTLLPDEGDGRSTTPAILHVIAKTGGAEELVETYGRIRSLPVRRSLLAMVKALAGEEEGRGA